MYIERYCYKTVDLKHVLEKFLHLCNETKFIAFSNAGASSAVLNLCRSLNNK